MVLDITSGYILYFTFILKIFYTRFQIDDNEFSWVNIFRLFHKDIDSKQINLNEQMAAKLWRSTLGLNNLTKIMIIIEVLSTMAVYLLAYSNLPDYFKYSKIGFAILTVEFILILNIFKTFESFYFLFSIVCKYLNLRTIFVLEKLNKFVFAFERKMNEKFVNEEISNLETMPFSNDFNQNEFDPYLIFNLLKEHDSICSLIRRYNYFWRFYLFAIFFTMPIIIGYFVFLLTFDNMYYIHRISLAFIIFILISYFYLVTAPAVQLSSKVSVWRVLFKGILMLCNNISFIFLNKIQKTIYPLKLLNKYRLPTKIKYKIETYLTRFESKVSFNCYEMFNVISETYLDVCVT